MEIIQRHFQLEVDFEQLTAPVLFLAGLAYAIYRYLLVTVGGHTYLIDAPEVWRPLAQSVLSGNPLYVPPAVDNKPALFELLNIGFEITGYYYLAFLLAVGIANGMIAALLYRLVHEHHSWTAATIAAVLFLASIPILRVYFVGVRSFAMAGILLAVTLSAKPSRSGFLYAAGVLFSQYVLFAAAPLFLWAYQREADPRRWILRFTAGVAGLVVVVYGIVGLFWGHQSAINGFWYSTGIPLDYAAEMESTALWNAPVEWLSTIAWVVSRQLHVVLGASAVGVIVFRRQTSRETQQIVTGFVVFAAVMSLPLLVRTRTQYFVYVWPWLCGLAGLGFDVLLQARAVR